MGKSETETRVIVTKDGPYVVAGEIPLFDQVIVANSEGESERWAEEPLPSAGEKFALCRCGHSSSKPFCDGTHKKIGFDGTETAPRGNYLDEAQMFDGPELALLDAPSLCAFARFCDPHGQVWSQVSQSGDPAVRAQFLRQVHQCPSGRLVAWDKRTGEAIEPDYEPSIGFVEDPAEGCSGPIALRGRIKLQSADGRQYESRNRVTLCRCGASKNKPFCDGSHASISFRAK